MFGRFRSPAWRDVDYVALDLETSGLDARRDVVLSVGTVPVRRGRIRWGERHYTLVKPPADHRPEPDALRVHHILPHEAEGAPSLPEVLETLREKTGEAVWLLHYGKLDLGFLKRAHRTLGRRWRRPTVVDTQRLLARLSHRRKHLDPYADSLPGQLGRARRELGLPAHVEHHALYDALATAELFLALVARLDAERLSDLT